jgi:hypothetical protein
MSSRVQNPNDPIASGMTASRQLDQRVDLAADRLLADLPNDLTRLIFLASIRDYNTGAFLHPALSHAYPPDVVDRCMKLQQNRVFTRLLECPVREYVEQLKMYASYAGVTRAELVTTWKDLGAYKSAVPLGSDKICTEIFALNVLTALHILEGVNATL